jgi:hypothetical protein
MEEDHDGYPHWYKLQPHQFIQGLVAHADDKQHVYVVTINQLRRPAKHPRVPRIVSIKGCA